MAIERTFEARWALRCWVIAVLIFVASFVAGIVTANAGPGGDTTAAWGPIIFPLYASLLYTPLLLVALMFSVRSIRAEGAQPRTVATLVLCILSLLPSAAILSVVILLLVQSVG